MDDPETNQKNNPTNRHNHPQKEQPRLPARYIGTLSSSQTSRVHHLNTGTTSASTATRSTLVTHPDHVNPRRQPESNHQPDQPNKPAGRADSNQSTHTTPHTQNTRPILFSVFPAGPVAPQPAPTPVPCAPSVAGPPLHTRAGDLRTETVLTEVAGSREPRVNGGQKSQSDSSVDSALPITYEDPEPEKKSWVSLDSGASAASTSGSTPAASSSKRAGYPRFINALSAL